MPQIRYECAVVEQVLAREYAATFQAYIKKMQGLNDIRPLVKEFENDFASYIGVKHARAVNSGSDALRLALRSIGLKKGDEVIIPDLTYQAVALAVVYSGGRPVCVDASPQDLNLDVTKVARLAGSRTRALVAAHMFGRPCDLAFLKTFCGRRGIILIEDVCQAESSRYRDKMLGSWGDLATFSFSYYKPLSSCGGGGGMVVFDNDEYCRIGDWQDDWRDNPELLTLGQRFAPLSFMDLISLKVKFSHLKRIIDSRKTIKALYERELSCVAGLKIFSDGAAADSVPQNFVVCCKRRDELMTHLAAREIMAQNPYTPLHAMAAYKTPAGRKFPVSSEYYQTALHLPLYSFMSEDKARQVVAACRSFFGRR